MELFSFKDAYTLPIFLFNIISDCTILVFNSGFQEIRRLKLMEINSLKEKMCDMEDSEEGNVQRISNYPNVRRHHRRGKRKPRIRRRTLSTELTPADDSAQNSSKEAEIKKSGQTKENPCNINVEKEKSLKEVGMNALSLKSNEAGHYKKVREYAKTHRQNRQHRHPRHRNFRNIYSHMSKILPSGEKMNSKMLILRPNRCPDAPKNSTQFIIDDHEDEEKDSERYDKIQI